MKSEIWQALETIPIWSKGESGYGISWEYPAFYKKFIGNICRCSKLHSQIVKKCQEIINSAIFDPNYVVVLNFYTQGLIIDVPIDRVSVYPHRSGYTSHNIGNANQCFALLTFLTTALREILSAMMVWEKDPTAGLDLPFGDHSYRIELSKENKPYVLWEAHDFSSFNPIALFFARGHWEADKILSEFFPGKELNSRSVSNIAYKGRFFYAFRKFRVEVQFEKGFPPKLFEIIAPDQYQAENFFEQWVQQKPFLAKIAKISITELAGIIEPLVIPL